MICSSLNRLRFIGSSRLSLIRGTIGGRTVALGILGSRSLRRRGLIRSRGLYLNEIGDPIFDSLSIEHNAFLAAAGMEDAALTALCTPFTAK